MSIFILNNALVQGTLSANNTIYDLNNNSTQWSAAFTSLTSTSGNWNSVYSLTQSKSASWDAASSAGSGYVTYASITPLSANWQSTYGTVSSLSANWQSTFVTVSSLSGNWNSVYSSWNNNSALDLAVRTVVNTTSGNWNSVYSLTQSKSASWDAASSAGSGYVTYASITPLSAIWQSTTTTVSSNSGRWESVYSYVNGASSIEANQSAATTWVFNNSANATFTSSVSSPSISAVRFFGDGSRLTGLTTGTVTKAASTIGNGIATTFAYAHNLATTDVIVNVYDLLATPKAVVIPSISITDANTVTLTFNTPPASNRYRVVVMA